MGSTFMLSRNILTFAILLKVLVWTCMLKSFRHTTYSFIEGGGWSTKSGKIFCKIYAKLKWEDELQSSDHMSVVRYYKFQEIGSDHLALVAEFAFVDYGSRESDNEDTKSNDSYEASTELASLSES